MLLIGHQILRQRSLDIYYKNPNRCLYCKSIIYVREKESPTRTRNKKFCNSSCSAIHSNILRGGKRDNNNTINCIECDKVLKYGKRYCSRKCQFIYKNKIFIDAWIKGEIDGSTKVRPSHIIRNFLLNKYNYMCGRCSWGERNPRTGKIPLEINHIDGNYKNNAHHNLEVLCPNCHSLTDTYRSLNKGNGRKFRYAPIAQLDEQSPSKGKVAGSSPAGSTIMYVKYLNSL